MKENKILYILLLASIVYIFMQKSCNKETNIITEEKETIVYDTLFLPSPIETKVITKYKTIKGDVINIPGKIDTLKVKAFELAVDTLKTRLFTEATRIREYKSVFSDSLADVTIYSKTKGELLEIVPTVTIKARLPAKETKFALYGGLGVKSNINLERLDPTININLQNKKGDLFGLQFGTDKSFQINYSIKIFNLKK